MSKRSNKRATRLSAARMNNVKVKSDAGKKQFFPVSKRAEETQRLIEKYRPNVKGQ